MKTGRIAIKRIFRDFKSCRWRYVSKVRAQHVRLKLTVASSTARGFSFMQPGVHSEKCFCSDGGLVSGTVNMQTLNGFYFVYRQNRLKP